LGGSIAAALAPEVNRLGRWFSRSLSIALVYIALLAVLIAILAVIVPPLVNQAQSFISKAPDLIKQGQQIVNQSPILSNGAISSQFWTEIGHLGTMLVVAPLSFLSSSIDIILVVVLSAYWLIVAPGLRRFILSLFPEHRRLHLNQVLEDMAVGMGGYIRGTFIVGVIYGITIYIGLLIIHMNYPLMLGVLAGLMEMVPYVGPFISGGAMVAIGLSQSLSQTLIVLAFAFIMQEIEGHLLVPFVMRAQTDISPLLAVIALFAGATIGGLIGALTAIPLAVALRVIVIYLVAPSIRKRTGA
jgi:predicted PurR-regulated permease PerM